MIEDKKYKDIALKSLFLMAFVANIMMMGYTFGAKFIILTSGEESIISIFTLTSYLVFTIVLPLGILSLIGLYFADFGKDHYLPKIIFKIWKSVSFLSVSGIIVGLSLMFLLHFFPSMGGFFANVWIGLKYIMLGVITHLLSVHLILHSTKFYNYWNEKIREKIKEKTKIETIITDDEIMGSLGYKKEKN